MVTERLLFKGKLLYVEIRAMTLLRRNSISLQQLLAMLLALAHGAELMAAPPTVSILEMEILVAVIFRQ